MHRIAPKMKNNPVQNCSAEVEKPWAGKSHIFVVGSELELKEFFSQGPAMLAINSRCSKGGRAVLLKSRHKSASGAFIYMYRAITFLSPRTLFPLMNQELSNFLPCSLLSLMQLVLF